MGTVDVQRAYGYLTNGGNEKAYPIVLYQILASRWHTAVRSYNAAHTAPEMLRESSRAHVLPCMQTQLELAHLAHETRLGSGA